MGYDCTFHLIDEKLIREELVPALLGRRDRPKDLDEHYDDADGIWAKVTASLQDGAHDAADMVCQLAVMLASCRYPHTAQRGLAFSLWYHQERISEDPPYGSPEPLFAALVEARPLLKHRFPTAFVSNYTTGIYYAPDRVPEVLEWLQKHLAKLDKGDREDYLPMVRALRTAARLGLGVWEATDLSVVQTHAELLEEDDPRPKGLSVHGLPSYMFPSIPWRGCDAMVLSFDFETQLVDLSSFPPKLERRTEERAIAVARSAAGRWAFLSTPAVKDRKFDLRLADSFTGPDVTVSVSHLSLDHEAAFVGDRAILFPSRVSVTNELLAHPISTDGAELRVEKDLPPAVGFGEGPLGPSFVFGSVRLGDGADVLIWDGNGWEREGNGWVKTFSLNAMPSHVEWTCVPVGDEGFYYLSDRMLFEVHRGKEPVRHLPTITNIMQIEAGPGGGLLLNQGQNKHGDVAKLYFPWEGRYAGLDAAAFGQAGLSGFHAVTWSRGAGLVIALHYTNLCALAEDDVLSRKRTKPRKPKS